MKPHERRACGAVTYYKLATYAPNVMTFRDGKRQYETLAAALAAAMAAGPGRYRVSRVDDTGRRDMPPFTVTAAGVMNVDAPGIDVGG